MTTPQPRFDAPVDDITEYRAVSSLAVGGLLAGLASVAVFLSPLAWFVPLAGLVLSGLALWRIARLSPALVGRKAAIAGLLLSIMFAVQTPADWYVHRRMVRGEARQFASLWFDAIHEGAIEKAHQLTLDPRRRRPLDQQLPDLYRNSVRSRTELKEFVAQPAVRTLLALGPKAQPRYYETVSQSREDGNRDELELIYAITYDDEKNQRKSFFVAVAMERSLLDSGRANWRVVQAVGDVRPPGW
jgi:hypothetical protein